jgi:glycosyltransferase involved in cell wall biosynthesis
VKLGRPRYSVVVPVSDEEEVLGELYDRLSRVLDGLDDPAEVIFVDDGTRDGAHALLRRFQEDDKRVRIVSLSRDFGYQAAISAGLAHATGERVAVLDADLQDPPELVGRFFQALDEGWDVVYGVRRARKEGPLKRLAYHGFYRLPRRLLRGVATIDVPLDSGDFCAMTRRVVDHLVRLPEPDRLVRGLRAWLGFRQLGIPYERDRRYAGAPKDSFVELLKLSVDGLVSFSCAPLRLLAGVGLLLSAGSFVGILIVLYRYLFTPYVPGYTSIAVLVLFLGGVQLLTMGLIGEYIGRISQQVKGRPLYVVDELVGFEGLLPTSRPGT